MDDAFNLYAFSSDNLANIWAGIGAGLWAVRPKEEDASRRGKAAKLKVPSFGILYSKADQVLTTPFVIVSRPDLERVEKDVWHGEWVLPFGIRPLGTPRRTISQEEARNVFPSFNRLSTTNFGYVFRVSSAYAFNRSDVTKADWEIIENRLFA